mgnify:CR=1 FL=1
MLNWKIRPRAVVGYSVKIFHPSPPNYVTRSPGQCWLSLLGTCGGLQSLLVFLLHDTLTLLPFFFWTANRSYEFMLSRMKSRLHRESGQSTSPSIPQGLTSVNTELSEITSRFLRVVGHNMAVFTPFYEDILVEIKSSLDWCSVTSAFWRRNRYIFHGIRYL